MTSRRRFLKAAAAVPIGLTGLGLPGGATGQNAASVLSLSPRYLGLLSEASPFDNDPAEMFFGSVPPELLADGDPEKMLSAPLRLAGYHGLRDFFYARTHRAAQGLMGPAEREGPVFAWCPLCADYDFWENTHTGFMFGYYGRFCKDCLPDMDDKLHFAGIVANILSKEIAK